MKKLVEYTIKFEQKSAFPKPISKELLLGNTLKYGSYTGLHLTDNKVDGGSFIAYLPTSIGRGIRITQDDEQVKYVNLTLKLPTTIEEIKEFMRISITIAKFWTCSISLDNKHLMLENLNNLEDKFQIKNLNVIKELVNECIENPYTVVPLDSAKHTLYFGKEEANLLTPVTKAKMFNDWLHAKQEKVVYIPDLVKHEESNGRIHNFIVVPLDIPCLLPNNKERYVSKYHDLEVCFYDEEKALCFIPYELFMMYLPKQKVFYFDSYQFLVSDFTMEDISCFLTLKEY